MNQLAVLICGKKSCKKRGAKKVKKAFKAYVENRGLDSRVQLIRTGCQSACSYGPSVQVQPGNHQYTEVGTGDVPCLIEDHLNGRENKKSSQCMGGR